MALITCKECGKEVSDAAKTCPHCGAPVVKEIYCSNCGEKVPATECFCPICGVSLKGAAYCSGSKRGGDDKIITALLAILVGGLGIHYFYLGKTKAGLLTILITICSSGLWKLIMICQGIFMFTLSDEAFKEKYINTTKEFPIF